MGVQIVPMQWRYGLSAMLWCACADYVAVEPNTHRLLRVSINSPHGSLQIINAAERLFEGNGDAHLLRSLARCALLLVCPPELSALLGEVQRQWGSLGPIPPPVLKTKFGSTQAFDPYAGLKDEDLWKDYRREAELWFAKHELEVMAAFRDWDARNGPADEGSNLDDLVDALCRIEGRPPTPV